MTTSTDAQPPAPQRARHGRRIGALAALGAALAAGGALLASSPAERPPAAAQPGRVSATVAWPQVQRADIPANLPDGPAYEPVIFLDARTSVGTAPSPDGTFMRLVLRGADGSVRQLRRLPLDGNPMFENFTVAGDDLAWAEATDASRFRLWTVNLRDGAPARQVTADTGNAVFYNSQYDLVIADGRLHWVASGPDDAEVTEIRSVPLAGGVVEVRTEPGVWALTAWPWLVNGASEQTGATLLRNTSTKRDVTVATSGVQTTTCSPSWCRIVVVSRDSNAQIDLMHPDGTARERIASGLTSPAVVDVAPLDRFEVLSEAGPDSDLTGTARLLVYEIATRRTVDVNPGASSVSYRNGVLWWSTGDRDVAAWHTVDLRTV